MNIKLQLPPFLTAVLGGLRAAPLTRATRPASAEPTEERPWGCGWFDSSHELQTGLLLQELARPEELAAELPLAFWLQLDAAGSSALSA